MIAHALIGLASWYSVACNGGTHTASGIPFNERHLVAAHKTLPFGTEVRVINKRNRRCVTVKIIDRGPYVKGRVVDVSVAAAKVLGFYEHGVAPVELQVLSPYRRDLPR